MATQTEAPKRYRVTSEFVTVRTGGLAEAGLTRNGYLMISLYRGALLPLDAPEESIDAPPQGPRRGGRGMSEREDVVSWGVATGRYFPARAQFWAKAAAEEKRKTGSTTETEATIRSLHPVYEVVEARGDSGSPWLVNPETGRTVLNTGRFPGSSRDLSDTPLLDDLDRAIFGPSIDERYRAEDLAAEAALAEAIERERQEAAPGNLTEAEERAIFGGDASS